LPPFLPPDQVADAFAEDIMSDAPDSDKCSAFADYVVETYISDHARYPPHTYGQVLQIWIRNEPTMDQRLFTPTLMDSFIQHILLYTFFSMYF
jgi:hypothetical protein